MAQQANFHFCIAETAEEKTLCYKLRYQVYTEEFGFEPPNAEGIERDQYDDQSVHILVIDSTGETAGTARVIKPSSLGFPILHVPCELTLPPGLKNEEAIEVSRVTVAKKYRRGFGAKAYGVAMAANDREAMKAPELMLGIISKVFWTGRSMNCKWLYLVTEEKVMRACHSYGFGSAFVAMGPEVDYHGRRTPYVAPMPELLAAAKQFNPTAHKYIKTREKEDVNEGINSPTAQRSEQPRNASAAPSKKPAAPTNFPTKASAKTCRPQAATPGKSQPLLRRQKSVKQMVTFFEGKGC